MIFSVSQPWRNKITYFESSLVEEVYTWMYKSEHLRKGDNLAEPACLHISWGPNWGWGRSRLIPSSSQLDNPSFVGHLRSRCVRIKITSDSIRNFQITKYKHSNENLGYMWWASNFLSNEDQDLFLCQIYLVYTCQMPHPCVFRTSATQQT